MTQLKRLYDLFGLLQIPNSAGLFFRKEYQILGGLFRLMAYLYRRIYLSHTRIIVVIGSLGKTTTRRIVHAALGCADRKFSHENYGTALAHNLLRVKPKDKHAVIEAGVGGPGWMSKYSRFLAPVIVVVTSIASDHHRSFPTYEFTRKEKVKRLQRLSVNQVAFLNGDDPNVLWMAGQTNARVVTFGIGKTNLVRAKNIEVLATGLRFDAFLQSQTLAVIAQLVGHHMIYPVLAALAVAEYESQDLDKVLKHIAAVRPVDGRMELLQAPEGYTLLDDSHKSSLESFYTALDALSNLQGKSKFFLFGDIDDPPGSYIECLRSIGAKAARCADKIIIIGSTKRFRSLRTSAIEEGLDKNDIIFLENDFDIIVQILEQSLLPGDVLLVKGRNSAKLNRIILRLMQQPVVCRATYCDIKSQSCGTCPLLTAPEEIFENFYISRYIRK